MEFELEPVERVSGYGALLVDTFGILFGSAVIMFGLFFIVLSVLVSRAERVGDGKFSSEFASRKRVPLFHMMLGAALVASGTIVAFFPF